MNERNKLLKRLQVCDFVLTEMGLFLDTHPNHRAALEYFNKYLQMKKEVELEYTKNYGPIQFTDNNNADTWNWIENPWPWENTNEGVQ